MNRQLKTALAAAAFTLTAALATNSHAAAYKCTDDSGKAVYSDIPCMKKPAPAAKPAAAAAAAPVAAAPVTKITEAEVLRVLTASQEYSRSNNHVGTCSLLASDMTFRTEFQGPKPKSTFGGRDEACKSARESAEMSQKTGLVLQSERTTTKVTIEPGELRAVAVYETSNRMTRYDRILDSFKCSSKDKFVLIDGKVLISSSEEVCKP